MEKLAQRCQVQRSITITCNMPLIRRRQSARSLVASECNQPINMRGMPSVWTGAATILADALDLPPRRLITINGFQVILLDTRMGDKMGANDTARKALETTTPQPSRMMSRRKQLSWTQRSPHPSPHPSPPHLQWQHQHR